MQAFFIAIALIIFLEIVLRYRLLGSNKEKKQQ